MPAPETLAAVLIAMGALAAALRFVLLRRGWQGWALAGLSLASGASLWFALFPPAIPLGGETLLVATAETPPGSRAGPSERLVTLPEAPTIAGAERVPDLATALRRHSQVQRLRIIGRGLTERDRDSAAGMPVNFTPMPPPRGLIRLDPPADTPAGAVFTLAGEAAGLEGGTAELLDPAGRRVDSRTLGGEGRFTLGATARSPGLATFTLRLRGRDKAIVSDTPVPLRTLEQRPVRALLIGAPSPEAKYLRRWAEDSGIALQSRLDAGAGVDLGGDGVRLDAASLKDADVVIIDDAALASLGSGGRASLAQAVAGGLGVVVRMTAPASAGARGIWRGLGFVAEGGSEIVPVALPPLAVDAEALAVQRGPEAPDTPDDLNRFDDPDPELGRWDLRAGADVVPVVTDADGAMLAGWQQRGQGRVAVWAVANSFALVLGGQGDRYAQWWSDALSAVARPGGDFRPELAALVQQGTRSAICGISEGAKVIAPDNTEVTLAIDPAAGARQCAAYWPSSPGVHRIVQPGEDGEQTFAFFVHPEATLAPLRAAQTGEATARWAAEQTAATARNLPERRSPGWPYFIGWLVLASALWLGERRLRAGAAQTTGPA
ncbi:carboxypeptidase regulatory-like domain-containing protein [Erythrobacter oryzae]|uniref:carboxypeptidase regulatory-like domain-containing protein n=1 Tax=Erythrobacter oryzae TaxID=3019556 RepID=UPI0025572602|nr:carboxypeptidase regulatory-like domain-containing protein [Erythrobacter sp. COR-2]